MPTKPFDDISKTLERSDKAKKQLRDINGKFISVSDVSGQESQTSSQKKSDYPPMVSLEVANPVTYLKLWWKKVMEKEGIDLKFRIHPVTAITLALIICGAGFGLGRLTFPADSPIVRYIPKLGPTPTESPWKEQAYSGVVQKSFQTGGYYLITNSSVAVSLNFPENVNKEKLVGRRILAVGKYNKKEEKLYVTDASDLEILPPQISPVPTISGVPTPTPTSAPLPTESEKPTPTMEVPPPIN